MAIEIERKFLVNHAKWNMLVKPAGKLFKQGYILSDDKRTVRIRVTDEAAYLTLKGSTTGISRSEYEYTIPIADGNEILNGLTVSSIEKIRYEIEFAGNTWEVDIFSGDNDGLIVAEIELEHEEQAFEKPDWVAAEVTDDYRYTNASLSVNPYKDWGGVSI
ncbi:CYTH domain-containing protein [Mucilaginibacter sp. ZT4R22]|uniref:CYTH domain-containing protein n=1 Tax=Mucilaginibacter pankratovii TaxID=2772110 RepID=A0ABR7WVX4_9SPHI|nr:CYTH domain-containing protein [Mucilaginibacter pankratovii]MBD1366436.1 CYTH domain-containing protein [Mucilaginibacter pankratovii]